MKTINLKQLGDDTNHLPSMKAKHTPGPYLAIFENKFVNNDAQDISVTVVDDIEIHAKNADELTAGHVEFKYVPVKQALAAHDLLEALKYARSRIMLLEQFTDDKLDNSNLKLIDSAIKKATE